MRPPARTWSALAWLTAFAVLAFGAGALVATPWAEAFDRTMAALPGPNAPLRNAMSDLTALGATVVLTLFTITAVIVLCLQRRMTAALQLIVAAAGAGLWVRLLKALHDRPRPDVAETLTHYAHASLPSGHAFGAAAVLLTLAHVAGSRQPRPVRVALWGSAACGVLLVAVSRVYLRVHHASDVVIGCALGALWAGSVAATARAFSDRRRADA